MYYQRNARRPKYNNIKTEADGYTFDSKKEARRYQELKTLEAAGIISELRLQVPFVICPRIEGVKGSRARKYVADFTYKEGGRAIIEDVKSAITRKNPVYTLKKQLVQWQYREYEFREV